MAPNLHRITLIALFVPFLCAQASPDRAHECTGVDLRAEMGPIRDQGDKGWCYANAAADLLSFKHRNELKGQQVSAGYTALTYLRSTFGSTGDGGFVSMAVRAAEEEGLCPRTIEDNVLKTGLSRLSLKSRLDGLKQFKADYDLSLEGDKAATERFTKRYTQYIDSRSIVGAIPRESLMRILDESTSRTFVDELAKSVCADQVRLPFKKSEIRFSTRVMSSETNIVLPGLFPGMPFPTPVHIPAIAWNPFATKGKLMRVIDEQLTKENAVAIDYFSDFLSTDFIKSPETHRGGMHASVLVGRRWNSASNSCEYLIRNSWGSGCYSYGVKKNCEGGNIWVPEKVLSRNLIAYIYLE